MKLNQFGQIVQRAWLDLPDHYPHVALGAFCIMPNHAHAIIVLDDNRRGGSIGKTPLPDIIISGNVPSPEGVQTRPYTPADTQTRPNTVVKRHPLSEIVRAFKSFSARRINALRKTQGMPVWQRNYVSRVFLRDYEHIIRNDDEYNRIQLYIESNPVNWMEDNENPGKKP